MARTVPGPVAAAPTVNPVSPQATPRAVRARLIGVDVARAVAVVGMLLVNSGPKELEGPATAVWTLAHGRASLLFVLLAGLGISLLARGRRSGRALAGVLLWRSAVLMALGALLGVLDHGAHVILPTYAALFVLSLALVRLRTRWLVGIVVGLVLVGPVLVLATLTATGREYSRDGLAPGLSVTSVGDWLVLTGPYPLVTWTAPFVLGMVLGRLDLSTARCRRGLVAWGSAGAAGAVLLSVGLERWFGPPSSPAGPDHLVVVTAHSQMPLWLVGGAAAGVAVLGVCLMAAERWARWLAPLAATGRLALTLYAAHLVVLHLVPGRPAVTLPGVEVPLALVLTVGAVAAAALWSRTGLQGPLERLMRPPWEARRPSP